MAVLQWAGEARVLMTALLAGLCQMLLVALCTSKWQVNIIWMSIACIYLWTSPSARGTDARP